MIELTSPLKELLVIIVNIIELSSETIDDSSSSDNDSICAFISSASLAIILTKDILYIFISFLKIMLSEITSL